MLNVRLILGLHNNKLLKSACICKNLPATKCMSDWVPKEKVIHTGQKWEADDYRLVRFIDRPKHVNDNFAIKLIDEVPPKVSKDRVVWCDGGSGPTGHPKVYINLESVISNSTSSSLSRMLAVLMNCSQCYILRNGNLVTENMYFEMVDNITIGIIVYQWIFNNYKWQLLASNLSPPAGKDKPGNHICGYCGLRFVLEEGHH